MNDSAQQIYEKKLAALKADYMGRLEKSAEQLVSLKAAISTEQDKREMIRIAHIISGSAGLFELNDLGEIARIAELDMEALPIPDIKNSLALDNLIRSCRDVIRDVDS